MISFSRNLKRIYYQEQELKLVTIIESNDDLEDIYPYLTWNLYSKRGSFIASRNNVGVTYFDSRPDHTAVLSSFTAPKYRNQGFGSLLLQEAILFLKEETSYQQIQISTDWKNKACQAMLKKCGLTQFHSSCSHHYNFLMPLR